VVLHFEWGDTVIEGKFSVGEKPRIRRSGAQRTKPICL
jgi:hypothetical protein